MKRTLAEYVGQVEGSGLLVRITETAELVEATTLDGQWQQVEGLRRLETTEGEPCTPVLNEGPALLVVRIYTVEATIISEQRFDT